jgi:hypothetical protein
MTSASDADDHEDMVTDCEDRESKLTEWEVNFIASLRERLDAGNKLTERQAEVLDRIWERIT